ncbi:MAG: hypothetical protein HFJ48_02960 [Clostridia bacterium]|nr:hypothetical protein [Clostridia bacterium]
MLILEIIKFVIYMSAIVLISKYILVKTLRRLAENLNLKPNTVGNIAGYATSVPELLTIGVASLGGLIGTSIYNILSSNIINLIQYLSTIFLNKNQKYLRNTAIKTDLILVFLTIAIPVLLIIWDIEISVAIVPIFIILFALFNFINNNVHKLYLKKEDKELEEQEEKSEIGNRKHAVINGALLIISGILLFIVGNLLGETLEQLCNTFNIPEIILGIILGFSTSIPELITFFESQKHHEKTKDSILGVVEATNNLFTSNVLNLFIIQSIGIIIYTIFA